jgi:hypothetical protein
VIKVEKRGKYGGVKIHLDPEEAKALMESAPILGDNADLYEQKSMQLLTVPLKLALKMGKKIGELAQAEPDLFNDRTPEEVAAILAKEVEKASLQLNAVKSGSQWQKVDPEKLAVALAKHVK